MGGPGLGEGASPLRPGLAWKGSRTPSPQACGQPHTQHVPGSHTDGRAAGPGPGRDRGDASGWTVLPRQAGRPGVAAEEAVGGLARV